MLAEAPLARRYGATYDLRLWVEGSTIAGSVDGELALQFEDEHRPLTGGAVAFVCEAGAMTSEQISVRRVG